MSGELLAGDMYRFEKTKYLSGLKLNAATEKNTPKLIVKVPVKHDIVHDLESFFWVLCWLCVSYEGPSTRRTTAWPEDEASTACLKKEIWDTFESTDPTSLASQKRGLLIHSDPDGSVLVRWCTPYFYPLLRLVIGVHATLKEAYENRTFTKLYPEILDQFAFAETMAGVPTRNATHPMYRAQEEAEDATRKREREGPFTEESTSPKVWKSKEQVKRDVAARHRAFARAMAQQGNTTPVKNAGPPSSGSVQKRSVRFDDDDSTEDAPAASSSNPPRRVSKRRREADDVAGGGDNAHASSSTTAPGEAEASTGPRRSTRSKTKAAQETPDTEASGSRPAKKTKPRSKKRARK